MKKCFMGSLEKLQSSLIDGMFMKQDIPLTVELAINKRE